MKVEAKKAIITVKKTIIAPIATPGPAYALAEGGNRKQKRKIKK